ncbi:unnamed protein product [Meganyctiphanes norvegica]|uniref:C-type lectin domain-containing protein n=1 Tax=Meganyctiphanes norvegica TaxID=48144 RepID=A0AAV2QCS7_MEGNR
MFPKVSLLILAFVGCAELKIEKNTSANYNIFISGCAQPFEIIGNNCYLFSDVEMDFQDASDFCESLTMGDQYEISLAVLDYGRKEDQDLLDSVASKNKIFWIGGTTEDGITWKWEDDRDVELKAPFWRVGEPNEIENQCMTAQSNVYLGSLTRAYLYDQNCGDSLSFICQVGCPINFRRIGSHCYMVSEDEGVPRLPWQDARDYCRTLTMPEGYHADLAVLGLPDQEDYQLMNTLVKGYEGATWLGGVKETECRYAWVDGRGLSLQSIYWLDNEPDCGSYNRVSLFHSSMHNRTYLNTYYDTIIYPFVCQIFKDTT